MIKLHKNINNISIDNGFTPKVDPMNISVSDCEKFTVSNILNDNQIIDNFGVFKLNSTTLTIPDGSEILKHFDYIFSDRIFQEKSFTQLDFLQALDYWNLAAQLYEYLLKLGLALINGPFTFQGLLTFCLTSCIFAVICFTVSCLVSYIDLSVSLYNPLISFITKFADNGSGNSGSSSSNHQTTAETDSNDNDSADDDDYDSDEIAAEYAADLRRRQVIIPEIPVQWSDRGDIAALDTYRAEFVHHADFFKRFYYTELIFLKELGTDNIFIVSAALWYETPVVNERHDIRTIDNVDYQNYDCAIHTSFPIFFFFLEDIAKHFKNTNTLQNCLPRLAPRQHLNNLLDIGNLFINLHNNPHNLISVAELLTRLEKLKAISDIVVRIINVFRIYFPSDNASS